MSVLWVLLILRVLHVLRTTLVTSILVRFCAHHIFRTLLHFVEVFSPSIKLLDTDKVHSINEAAMFDLEI